MLNTCTIHEKNLTNHDFCSKADDILNKRPFKSNTSSFQTNDSIISDSSISPNETLNVQRSFSDTHSLKKPNIDFKSLTKKEPEVNAVKKNVVDPKSLDIATRLGYRPNPAKAINRLKVSKSNEVKLKVSVVKKATSKTGQDLKVLGNFKKQETKTAICQKPTFKARLELRKGDLIKLQSKNAIQPKKIDVKKSVAKVEKKKISSSNRLTDRIVVEKSSYRSLSQTNRKQAQIPSFLKSSSKNVNNLHKRINMLCKESEPSSGKTDSRTVSKNVVQRVKERTDYKHRNLVTKFKDHIPKKDIVYRAISQPCRTNMAKRSGAKTARNIPVKQTNDNSKISDSVSKEKSLNQSNQVIPIAAINESSIDENLVKKKYQNIGLTETDSIDPPMVIKENLFKELCNPDLTRTVLKTPYPQNIDSNFNLLQTISDSKSIYSTKRRNHKRDKHSDIASWMNSVDAVIEKSIGSDDIFNEDRLFTALKSLGQLGLMAAEAADSSPIINDETSNSPAPQEPLKSAKQQSVSLNLTSPKVFDRIIYRSQTPLRTSLIYRDSTPLLNFQYQQSVDPTPKYIGKNQYTPNINQWTFSQGKKQTLSTPHAPKRFSSLKANQELYKGIIQQQINTVKHALKNLGADPNNYFRVPMKQVPWVLAPPFDPYKKSRSEDLYVHPLHLAVAYANTAIVRELLLYGACVNAVDEWGRHSLHILSQPPVRNCKTLTSSEKHELAKFLFKEIIQRSSKQIIKITEQIYHYNVDLDYETVDNLTCTDHISIWAEIKEEINNGNIALNPKEIDNTQPNMPLSFVFNTNVPLPLIPQINPVLLTEQNIKDALISRIPQDLLDFLIILNGRARLSAIAPIIDFDIALHKKVSSNFSKNCPMETPVRRHLPLYMFRMSICSASRSMGSPYTILSQYTNSDSKKEGSYYRSSVGFASVLLASIIRDSEVSTPTVTLHPPNKNTSDPRIMIHRKNKIKSSKELSKNTDMENIDTDVLKFFEFVKKHRSHPVLLHIWEFLGAKFIPNSNSYL